MDTKTNKEIAKILRIYANQLYDEKNYKNAVEYYSNAISLEDIPEYDKMLLFSNRMEAYLKLNDIRNTMKDMLIIKKSWPQWWKVSQNNFESEREDRVYFNEKMMKFFVKNFRRYFKYFNKDDNINRQSIIDNLEIMRKIKITDEKYDFETLELHAKNDSEYANKLFKAKNHFINALLVFVKIKNINKPTDEECKEFVLQLSECAKIAYKVAFLMEPINTFLICILKCNTDYDCEARICCTKFNKDIEFLNECIELFPNCDYFYKKRAKLYYKSGNHFECCSDVLKILDLVSNDEDIAFLSFKIFAHYFNEDIIKIEQSLSLFLSVACNDHKNVAISYYLMARVYKHRINTIYNTKYVNLIK
jgi:large-conductance mechanosensitive channel